MDNQKPTEQQLKDADISFHDLEEIILKREREKKGKGAFIQIEREALFNMINGFTKPLHWRVLSFLIAKMNKTNALMMSQKQMWESLGISRSSLRNTLNELMESRFINVLKVGNMNCYCVNKDVAWKTGRDKKDSSFSIFQADVIVDKSEQSAQRLAQMKKPLRPAPKYWMEDQMLETETFHKI